MNSLSVLNNELDDILNETSLIDRERVKTKKTLQEMEKFLLHLIEKEDKADRKSKSGYRSVLSRDMIYAVHNPLKELIRYYSTLDEL